MPNSSAVVSTANMELTPVRVTYNGVDLGGTHGNVKVSIETSKAEIKADQSGETVRDRRISGLNIKIETALAEIRDINKWKVVFPNQPLLTTGGNSAMQFQNKIGASDLAAAKQLVLHPLSRADADLSGDILIYKAVADEKSEITYSPSGQALLKILWNVLPDTTTVPERFMFYGDPSIGLVAATAGSPAFTGTGDGTVTSVAVYNGFTATETITVKCVGDTTGNDFFVSGSVSGALGEFNVAALAGSLYNFVSDKISFTLTQGATQFVYGDEFTIATTASNNI
jgi:hypothetical protein